MLTPTELSNYPNEIVKLYEELEAYLISDLSRQISKSGNTALTGTSKYNIQALEEIGFSRVDIEQKIAKTNDLAISQVNKLFEDANIQSFKREKETFELGGKTLVFSAAKKQILDNSIKAIASKLLSFTGSLGMKGLALEKCYQDALNTAYVQIQSGVADYITAIKNQVKQLAESGLQIINYESGHIDKLDVAVRRAVLTGLKDTTNQISEINAKEMGCNGYEVSAHMGARKSHKNWQGRQFAIYISTDKYPLYSDVVGSQMSEANCRHSKWGIFLGDKPLLTEAQLENIDPTPFKFNIGSKSYTFNAEQSGQKQRSMERAVRKTKREIIGYKDDSKLANELTATKAKLRTQTQLYKEFSKTAGLLEQTERLGVIGYRKTASNKIGKETRNKKMEKGGII